MTPERFLEAYDRFEIQDNRGNPTNILTWFVVDISTAEPKVNWPGDLVSEHQDRVSARLAWAAAIIKTAESES